jgi:hypothetical protein
MSSSHDVASDVYVTLARGMHSFRPGDEFTFSGVLGADRARLNNQPFVIATAGVDNFTAAAPRRVDTFYNQPDFDVSSSYIIKTRTPTKANKEPAAGAYTRSLLSST